MKNPSTNQALSNTIKVIQGIDINDFKTIHGAVVLASRTRHSSILPIETVFIDNSSNNKQDLHSNTIQNGWINEEMVINEKEINWT